MVHADNFGIGSFVAHENLRIAQEQMIKDGIIALEEKGFLFAAAPTGIGKTAASLASALEVARNSESAKQILFLTGRQSQHRIVVETIKKINSRINKVKPDVKVVDIIGRESMCEDVDRITGKCSCEEDIVEGSKQKRREDLKEIILESPKHVDDIIKIGKKRKICSWTAARSAVKDCDILICDYNHVFIENVSESSLSAMKIDLENTILIIDEAHNLPDRIRNGLERRAIMKTFRDSRFEIEEYLGSREQAMKKLDLSELQDNYGISDIKEALRQMKKLEEEMKKWYKKK